MNAFQQAVDVALADPNLSADAVYTPAAGGEPVTVRIAERAPETRTQFLTAGVRGTAATQAAALAVEVRAADVATPERGGTITYGGLVYPVVDVDRAAGGLTWVLTLGKGAAA